MMRKLFARGEAERGLGGCSQGLCGEHGHMRACMNGETLHALDGRGQYVKYLGHSQINLWI